MAGAANHKSRSSRKNGQSVNFSRFHRNAYKVADAKKTQALFEQIKSVHKHQDK